jgi:AcrR family transcriptional regulator
MKTKEKILTKALELFNLHGISTVSSRTISEELGISYGNLTYHFPKKDDIILALYLNMQEEIDELFVKIRQEIMQLDFMLRNLRVLLEVFHKYKFIFLGFARMNRKFEEIRQHAIRQNERRKNLLNEIAAFLIQIGYLKEEKMPGHYEMVIHGLLVIFNSWIADAEFFYHGPKEKKIDYYLEMFYAMVRPSLTKEGLKAFNEVYELEG